MIDIVNHDLLTDDVSDIALVDSQPERDRRADAADKSEWNASSRFGLSSLYSA